jgi:predicted nucleotidyltransferase
MRALKATTDQPEVADRFNRVLGETIEALEASKVNYVFIGGIASGGLGRPRSTHDIDVFVKPEDAEIVLRALAKQGFRTEKTDPSWLYKGFKENILVDVIFKSKGEIYLDPEMYRKSIQAEFHGKQLKLVAPEDLVIIKAIAHSELTPGHWHDALALLTHANIDWDYLLRRARKAPRRLLSLMLYAHSNDIWVPKNVIDELYRAIFGDSPQTTLRQPSHASHSAQSARTHPPVGPRAVPKAPDSYSIGKLRDAIARDPRTNELDVLIETADGKILLRGEVLTEERRQAASEIARECCPGHHVENQIRVTQLSDPIEAEEMK